MTMYLSIATHMPRWTITGCGGQRDPILRRERDLTCLSIRPGFTKHDADVSSTLVPSAGGAVDTMVRRYECVAFFSYGLDQYLRHKVSWS